MNSKIIKAVLNGDDEDLRYLLQQVPDITQARMKRDLLIKAIPHWLYVGDTSLHLAAAGPLSVTECAKHLERAQSECRHAAGDSQAVARLSADLGSARLAAARLDQLRREETPRDAQTDGVNRGSIFYGGQR